MFFTTQLPIKNHSIFCFLRVSILQILHISGIIEYLFYCGQVYLASHPQGLSLLWMLQDCLLLKAVQFSITFILHIVFIHSFSEESLFGFQISAFVNNASMNIGVPITIYPYVRGQHLCYIVFYWKTCLSLCQSQTVFITIAL